VGLDVDALDVGRFVVDDFGLDGFADADWTATSLLWIEEDLVGAGVELEGWVTVRVACVGRTAFFCAKQTP
jgi:hypothetical protein